MAESRLRSTLRKMSATAESLMEDIEKEALHLPESAAKSFLPLMDLVLINCKNISDAELALAYLGKEKEKSDRVVEEARRQWAREKETLLARIRACYTMEKEKNERAAEEERKKWAEEKEALEEERMEWTREKATLEEERMEWTREKETLLARIQVMKNDDTLHLSDSPATLSEGPLHSTFNDRSLYYTPKVDASKKKQKRRSISLTQRVKFALTPKSVRILDGVDDEMNRESR